MQPEGSLPHSQVPANCPYPEPTRSNPCQKTSPSPCEMFCNIVRFYIEKFLASRPTPKLEGHPLSAVRDCLFSIFAAPLHIWGRSSVRNLMTRHAVVTVEGIRVNTSWSFRFFKFPHRLWLAVPTCLLKGQFCVKLQNQEEKFTSPI